VTAAAAARYHGATVNGPAPGLPRVRHRRPWRVAGGHALFTAAFVALVASAAPAGGFVDHLPEGVPDLGRLSKASGSAELENGTSLEYELYYDTRRGNYEIIRYRVSGWDGGGEGPYSANERLQWQAQVKDVRRYECEPSASGGCRWRELARSGAEYRREVRIVMWVLGLHNRLLHEREEGRRR
jgi:hypothetical protein